MTRYYINPTDGRKSFYGKAFVQEANGYKELTSYKTTVAAIDADGQFIRLWDGWSATTARHINAFREMNGLNRIGKAELTSLPIGKSNMLTNMIKVLK